MRKFIILAVTMSLFLVSCKQPTGVQKEYYFRNQSPVTIFIGSNPDMIDTKIRSGVSEWVNYNPVYLRHYDEDDVQIINTEWEDFTYYGK